MIRHFPSKEYRIICVDLPGHGGTSFDSCVDEPTIESYAKSLREFFEVTNLEKSKVCLVGCSFGGLLSIFSSTK